MTLARAGRTWTAGALIPLLSAAAAERPPAVEADYAKLRAVVVMSIDESIRKSSEMGSSVHPVFHKGLAPDTIEEHRAFVDLLRKDGVRVLQVRDLLQDAVENARRAGELEPWIREVFPSQAGRIVLHLDRVDADAILQQGDALFYRPGDFDPLFLPVASMYWCRDFAVSTPRGVVIGSGQAFARSLENGIARLLFRHARALRGFPVVFDAAKEGILLDGGDVIVMDENTLLVGVGQRSDREAAPRLAKKLGMEVIAVAMPPRDKPSGMSRQLLHLDSIFNLLDRDLAVSIPWILEKDSARDNPVLRILAAFARQTDEIRASLPAGRAESDSAQLRLTMELMPEVGWLTRYEAGSGAATPLGMKLVDFARQRGCRVVFAGGERGGLSETAYALERALYELRWQGVNVAQLAPRKVIACAQNRHTNEALRRAGVKVLTFPGAVLSIRNGGPHCLMLPLVRASGARR